MKMQRLLSIGLLIAASSSFHNASAAVTDGIKGISMGIYQSNWHAVQDIFVTQPYEASKQSYWPIAPDIIGAGAAAIGALILLPELADYGTRYVWPFAQREYSDQKIHRGEFVDTPLQMKVEGERKYLTKATIHSPLLYIAGVITSAIGGWKLVDKLCRYRSLKFAERKQMELVLNSWKEVRAHIPEELLPALDALHKLKTENSADYTANVDRTLCFIKQSAKKHFARPLWTRVLGSLHNLEY